MAYSRNNQPLNQQTLFKASLAHSYLKISHDDPTIGFDDNPIPICMNRKSAESKDAITLRDELDKKLTTKLGYKAGFYFLSTVDGVKGFTIEASMELDAASKRNLVTKALEVLCEKKLINSAKMKELLADYNKWVPYKEALEAKSVKSNAFLLGVRQFMSTVSPIGNEVNTSRKNSEETPKEKAKKNTDQFGLFDKQKTIIDVIKHVNTNLEMLEPYKTQEGMQEKIKNLKLYLEILNKIKSKTPISGKEYELLMSDPYLSQESSCKNAPIIQVKEKAPPPFEDEFEDRFDVSQHQGWQNSAKHK